MTALLAVNVDGTYVDTPMQNSGGYSTTAQEISYSSRNLYGNLYKLRLTVKRTISVEWNLITPEEKTSIASMTNANSVQVKYFDIDTSEIKYGKFYRGSDYKITPQIRYDSDNNEFLYYNVKMSLVEF